MCGICGVVSIRSVEPVERSVLMDMTQLMRHRGPDDQGIYLDKYAGLGSRRLSIIDLEGGRQPIANEDETAWIIFNGEIYNYRELRAYLQKRDHVFRTHTDTEVILHLYEEFGSDCVQHLDGIFAFAIWNQAARHLFVARDRMGVKPLYYAEVCGKLIFGSEMKVLLSHPEVEKDIDLISLNEYLSYEYVPSPRTIIRGVHRLRPGHTLRYDEQGVHIERYWNISRVYADLRGKLAPKGHLGL